LVPASTNYATSTAPADQYLGATTATFVGAWGACALFIQSIPLLDLTLVGNLLRVIHAVVGIGLAALLLPRIIRALSGIEAVILLLYVGLVVFAGLHTFFLGETTSAYSVLRLVFMPVLAYVISKSLDSAEAIHRYLAIFYFICLVSAIQAVAAFAGEFLGYRSWGTISLTGGSFPMSWYGLLGGGFRFRTNFYFSEPSHYSHILIPALFYALETRRRVGAVIIYAGLLTTGALISIAATGAVIVLYCLRRGRVFPLLVFLPAVAYAASPQIRILMNFAFQLLNRDPSAGDKIAGYSYAFSILQDHPLGLGLIDIFDVNVLYPASGGIAQLLIWFGILALPFVFVITGYLTWEALAPKTDHWSSAIAFGLLGSCIATIGHEPWLKYWMIFMLGALVTYGRIARSRRRASRYADPIAFIRPAPPVPPRGPQTAGFAG
jgi:hypothetical protein